jgi:hypothetical protein
MLISILTRALASGGIPSGLTANPIKRLKHAIDVLSARAIQSSYGLSSCRLATATTAVGKSFGDDLNAEKHVVCPRYQPECRLTLARNSSRITWTATSGVIDVTASAAVSPKSRSENS